MGNDLKGMLAGVSKGVDSLKDAASKAKEIAKESANKDTLVNEKSRSEAFKKICGIIPGKIDNSVVVNAFELMRKQQKLLKKDFSAQIKANEDSFKKHLEGIKKNHGYVEDQNNYTDMKYGISTMQFSGCEIFATFNAIFNIMGKQIMSLPEMISEYEKDGMVMSGKFGTAPKAICDFLEKHGFKTKMVTDEKDFDSIGKESQSMILTMYNDKNDISKEVHTVNISKEKGLFTAHNVYCNGKVVGPYKSVSEIISNINHGKAKGISLIGITKK